MAGALSDPSEGGTGFVAYAFTAYLHCPYPQPGPLVILYRPSIRGGSTSCTTIYQWCARGLVPDQRLPVN